MILDTVKFKDRFGENITIIGLREAFGSSRNRCVRIIWITFFIICLMCTGYFVSKTCTEYLGEPTATKVSFSVILVAISICLLTFED